MISIDTRSNEDRLNIWKPSLSFIGCKLLDYGFNLDVVRSWGDRECFELDYKYFATYHLKTQQLNILGENFRINCKINELKDFELVLNDLKNNNTNGK